MVDRAHLYLIRLSSVCLHEKSGTKGYILMSKRNFTSSFYAPVFTVLTWFQNFKIQTDLKSYPVIKAHKVFHLKAWISFFKSSDSKLVTPNKKLTKFYRIRPCPTVGLGCNPIEKILKQIENTLQSLERCLIYLKKKFYPLHFLLDCSLDWQQVMVKFCYFWIWGYHLVFFIKV